jgi:twitching motility protein PilT
MALDINELLRAMVAAGASDLHIKAGSCAGFRIDGRMRPQEAFGTLGPEETRAIAYQLLSAQQKERFERDRDLDFSYAVKDVARFRINVLVQRGAVSLVIRQIPDHIPNAAELGLPPICMDLALKPRGLVLVTGPTGAGKSTTLAALVDHVNSNTSGHILTMEDPIEFVHRDKKCFVTQRQIGQDCADFAQALRRALRQDPDVILIGEMRDLETISMAITAAGTGHLVLATLHTTGAISTVDRMIDVFPKDAQAQVRVQLAEALQGVISQTLVPTLRGKGRACAREILIATDGVRSLIREGRTAQLLNMLQTGRSHGMVTLEDELVRLASEGTIRPEEAILKANRPEAVAAALAAASGPGARPAARAPVATSGGGERAAPAFRASRRP